MKMNAMLVKKLSNGEARFVFTTPGSTMKCLICFEPGVVWLEQRSKWVANRSVWYFELSYEYLLFTNCQSTGS